MISSVHMMQAATVFGVDCKSNGVMSTSHDLHTDQAQLSKYTNIWIMQLFAFL